MTRLGKALAVLALALAFVPVAASMQSADATLQAATAYVSTFEKAFAPWLAGEPGLPARPPQSRATSRRCGVQCCPATRRAST